MEQRDFSMARMEDGTLNVSLTPPTNITGWTIEFETKKYFGGESGLIKAYTASGYITGQSGITVTSQAQGVLAIRIPSPATSGWNFGNYTYGVTRLDSGFNNVLAEGFQIINPSIAG